MNQIVAKNKKLQSGIKIAKNFNHNLEQRIVEKNLTEGGGGGGEQYSLRNNVEISDITDSIPDKDLENTVKSICKDSRVKIQRILRAVTDSHSQEIAEGKIKE